MKQSLIDDEFVLKLIDVLKETIKKQDAEIDRLSKWIASKTAQCDACRRKRKISEDAIAQQRGMSLPMFPNC